MPSDDRTQRALRALSREREAFRSAVAGAAEQVRALLSEHLFPRDGRAGRVAAELGPFAAGRLSAERFASVFSTNGAMEPAAASRIQDALRVLTEVLERGDALFVAEVHPGGDLRDTVARALARAGRAFGAARAVELARTGNHAAADPADYAGGFPFRRWNRAERRIAPPLVVEVDGRDAQAAGLAELLDGAQRIVLVVRGECPPAPLARLVTPGVRVLQTADPAELERVAGGEGPAVAALVPETAARFLHDPARSGGAWERLSVAHLPEAAPRGPLGKWTAFQMADELRHLRELAAPPAVAAAAGAPEEAVEPADRLAAWLLSQSSVADPA